LKGLCQRFTQAKEGDRLSDESIEQAIDIIEQQGMKAHYYLASVDHRENEELSFALDTLNAAGFIITDSSGALVGKTATKRITSSERAEALRAQFKLVD